MWDPIREEVNKLYTPLSFEERMKRNGILFRMISSDIKAKRSKRDRTGFLYRERKKKLLLSYLTVGKTASAWAKNGY